MRRIIILSAILVSFFVSQSARAQVLVEIYRNINCGNCRTPDDSYAAFLASHPEYQAQVVNFHNSITDANDPFYLATAGDAEYRSTTFYKLISDPDAYINGISGGGNNVSQWEQLTTAAHSVTYPVSIAATASINATGKLQVDLQLSGSSSGKQVKPYVMLLESGIIYKNTMLYGSEPNDTWDNIFRAMIPKKDGGDPVIINGASNVQYLYDTTGRNWNINNCKIIAFVQAVTPRSDNKSHDVLGLASAQIAKAAVSGTMAKSSNSLSQPVPNPAQAFVKIPFTLATPADVKIVITDDLGREITTLVNKFVAETESSILFIPKNLSQGIYYARFYVAGEYAGMQKIVLAP